MVLVSGSKKLKIGSPYFFSLKRDRSWNDRRQVYVPFWRLHRLCMPRLVFWQVIEAFGKEQNPQEVSERLVQAAQEAGSGDDITVVVAKLG